MDEHGARFAAAADVVEIGQLILAERQAVSHQWWDLAADCHVDGAEIHVPDFTGTVHDYLRRRREEHGGWAEHWSVATPVVHLHHDRAVATADATAASNSAAGELGTAVRTSLVVRVQRRHRAWRLVRLDACPALDRAARTQLEQALEWADLRPRPGP